MTDNILVVLVTVQFCSVLSSQYYIVYHIVVQRPIEMSWNSSTVQEKVEGDGFYLAQAIFNADETTLLLFSFSLNMHACANIRFSLRSHLKSFIA